MAVEGALIEAEMPTLSGSQSVHRYCAKCLTRLYNTNTARPGIAIVRAGTVNGSEGLGPRLHIFTSTKQPWITLPEGVPAYPENAPVEVWQSLFGK